jgi:hypothetical protein
LAKVGTSIATSKQCANTSGIKNRAATHFFQETLQNQSLAFASKSVVVVCGETDCCSQKVEHFNLKFNPALHLAAGILKKLIHMELAHMFIAFELS